MCNVHAQGISPLTMSCNNLDWEMAKSWAFLTDWERSQRASQASTLSCLLSSSFTSGSRCGRQQWDGSSKLQPTKQALPGSSTGRPCWQTLFRICTAARQPLLHMLPWCTRCSWQADCETYQQASSGRGDHRKPGRSKDVRCGHSSWLWALLAAAACCHKANWAVCIIGSFGLGE